ncbi:MAG: SDR family oxidoreductase [Solirubrobacterales bacterium]
MSTEPTGRRRIAAVTGASSGIGEALARALAAAGFDLALLARRADRIERLADELRRDGGRAVAIELDVSDEAAAAAAARAVREALGPVDLLVNNAGLMQVGPFGPERAAEARRMVETNLLGAISVTAAFLDQLRERKGDLVNVSSLAGRTSAPRLSVYNATKWGLNGWTEALRQELAPDVRVILVEPGVVGTELLSHTTDEPSRTSMERWYERVGALTPEEVAGVIAYAVCLPHHVSLSELVVRATSQA